MSVVLNDFLEGGIGHHSRSMQASLKMCLKTLGGLRVITVHAVCRSAQMYANDQFRKIVSANSVCVAVG